MQLPPSSTSLENNCEAAVTVSWFLESAEEWVALCAERWSDGTGKVPTVPTVALPGLGV